MKHMLRLVLCVLLGVHFTATLFAMQNQDDFIRLLNDKKSGARLNLSSMPLASIQSLLAQTNKLFDDLTTVAQIQKYHQLKDNRMILEATQKAHDILQQVVRTKMLNPTMEFMVYPGSVVPQSVGELIEAQLKAIPVNYNMPLEKLTSFLTDIKKNLILLQAIEFVAQKLQLNLSALWQLTTSFKTDLQEALSAPKAAAPATQPTVSHSLLNLLSGKKEGLRIDAKSLSTEMAQLLAQEAQKLLDDLTTVAKIQKYHQTPTISPIIQATQTVISSLGNALYIKSKNPHAQLPIYPGAIAPKSGPELVEAQLKAIPLDYNLPVSTLTDFLTQCQTNLGLLSSMNEAAQQVEVSLRDLYNLTTSVKTDLQSIAQAKNTPSTPTTKLPEPAVTPIAKITIPKEFDFNTIATWFPLPQFKSGNPITQPIHEKVINLFGNKTFNLCVLSALAQAINTILSSKYPQFSVAVPPFMGISNQELTDYLNSTIKLKELWNQFIEQQKSAVDLDSAAVVTLKTIRQNIEKVFSNSKEIPQNIKALIQEFIDQHRSNLFMVRSSGYEDRTDIANAGGNESVAAVKADVSAIWQAMGVVIQSYFSEKSLQQRLLAKDTITKPFFIPVLLQVMIGEKIWTGKNPTNFFDIPISGVMFTQEAEGNTPNVVQIQAAFGHNQGVVNSLVPVDTFYSGPSDVLHPIIRKKTERLVPVKSTNGYQLDTVHNPKQLQEQPVFSLSLAHSLKLCAQQIQQIYNHAMDIEFVIKKADNAATIYLVQARPLIQTPYQQSPSYLTDEFVASLSPNQLISGNSLGTAGGFVRTVTDSNQLLIRDDLPKALNEYHANSAQYQNIVGVIINKMAPATSHEATQFRGYSIPVLVVPVEKSAFVSKLLSQGPLLFDTQRALLAHNDKALGNSSAAGWYTHPIPMVTSIIAHYMLATNSHLQQNYHNYLKELMWQENDKDNSQQSMRELVTIIKQDNNDRAKTIDALKRIIHRASRLLNPTAASPSTLADYMSLYLQANEQENKMITDETKLVVANIIICALEILYTIDYLQEAKLDAQSKRLAYLYPIKFLEASIFQQNNPEVVNGYSYLLLRKMLQEDIQAIEKLRPKLYSAQEIKKMGNVEAFEYGVQFEKMGVLALNPDIEEQWQTFVTFLTKMALIKNNNATKKLVRDFATTINKLNNLNVLDLWLNTSFTDTFNQKTNTLTTAQALIDEIEGTNSAGNKQTINWVNQRKNVVQTWENKINEWANPAQFAPLYNQFKEQFIDEFIIGTDRDAQRAYTDLMGSDGNPIAMDQKRLFNFAQKYSPLIKMFNSADKLGKLILIQFFKKVIDVYDKSIKELLGSPAYTDKNIQTQHFKRLLLPYTALMESMITLIWSHEDALMLTKAWGNRGFSAYLTLMRDTLNNFSQENNKRHLLLSGKSMGAAQIGSKADLGRSLPLTLHDLFTVEHQNMLVVLASLVRQLGITKDLLPPLVQDIATALERVQIHGGGTQKEQEAFKSSLIGIDYSYPNLQVYYNIPLRQHSSTFEIQYNKNKPNRAVLVCKFFGHNEGNRMSALVSYANFASLVSGIPFESKPTTTDTFTESKTYSVIAEFSWIITPSTDLFEITRYIELMGKKTLIFSRGLSYLVLQDTDKIKPFLTDDVRYYINEAENRSSNKIFIPQEILSHAFDKLPDHLFSNDIFVNEWFIRQYMEAKLYQKAFSIVKATIQYIIKENSFRYPSNITVRSVWSEVLNTLALLKKIPETSQEAQKLYAQIEPYIIQHENDR